MSYDTLYQFLKTFHSCPISMKSNIYICIYIYMIYTYYVVIVSVWMFCLFVCLIITYRHIDPLSDMPYTWIRELGRTTGRFSVRFKKFRFSFFLTFWRKLSFQEKPPLPSIYTNHFSSSSFFIRPVILIKNVLVYFKLFNCFCCANLIIKSYLKLKIPEIKNHESANLNPIFK